MGKIRFSIESGLLGNGKDLTRQIQLKCDWVNVKCNVIKTKIYLGKEYHFIIEGEDEKLIEVSNFVEQLTTKLNLERI